MEELSLSYLVLTREKEMSLFFCSFHLINFNKKTMKMYVNFGATYKNAFSSLPFHFSCPCSEQVATGKYVGSREL